MASGHPGFSEILDHAAGRGDPGVAAHAAGCKRCAQSLREAERLVAAGRRAALAPLPGRRALRRARRIFAGARPAPGTAGLRLVLDSLLRPAPALRAASTAPTRFLRYEGARCVDLQVAARERGLELRGQVAPAHAGEEVVLRAGATRRRASVAADGTFVLRAVPRGLVEIRIGKERISGLTL